MAHRSTGTTPAQADVPERRLIGHSASSRASQRPPQHPARRYRTNRSRDTFPPERPALGATRATERIGRARPARCIAPGIDLHRDVALKLLHEEGVVAIAKRARGLLARPAGWLASATPMSRKCSAPRNTTAGGLWMELVRGESLEHIVKTRGPSAPGKRRLLADPARRLRRCTWLVCCTETSRRRTSCEKTAAVSLMDFWTGEELAARTAWSGRRLTHRDFPRSGGLRAKRSHSLGVLLFYLVTGQFPSAPRPWSIWRAHATSIAALARRPARCA
jgi:hypothetical protein